MERKVFNTQKEASQYVTMQERDPYTIKELLERYIYLCPKVKTKQKIFFDFVEMFGSFTPKDLNTTNLRFWLDSLQNENSYSDATMITIKTYINSFIKVLLIKKVIETNPLSPIIYKQLVHKKVYLSDKKVETIYKTAQKKSPGYIYPMLSLILDTGLKTGELKKLEWKNLKKDSVKLPNRELKVKETTLDLIHKIPRRSKYIFTDQSGNQLNKCKLARIIRPFINVNNLPDFNLAQFRDYYAKNRIKEGASLKQLQYALGHSRVELTKKLFYDNF